MKKISLVSAFVFISAMIVFAFTFAPAENPQTKNMVDHIRIHVTGCTDFTDLTACIDGSVEYKPGKRDFEVECHSIGPEVQTICVKCQGKVGTGKIECNSDKLIEINLTSSGFCPCE
jgi:hypothetical protein